MQKKYLTTQNNNNSTELRAEEPCKTAKLEDWLLQVEKASELTKIEHYEIVSVALMQERVIQTPKGRESKFLPIAFHSGSFQGSEVNWAAFQKEAAAIHRGIKRLSFYLYEADVET